MNNQEYWKEVNDIADIIACECMDECGNDRDQAEELINDSRLHETIDGHQWVIYYAYNLDVIKHSDNADYMIDNFGGECAESILKDSGIDGLHTAIAFWCLYADVQELIDDKLTKYEDAAWKQYN